MVVDHARAVRLGTSRCASEFECAAADVEGKAPDILASASPDEAWARLPRLSTLAVQVVTNPNSNSNPNPTPTPTPNPNPNPNKDGNGRVDREEMLAALTAEGVPGIADEIDSGP